jgi:hypothetical protein
MIVEERIYRIRNGRMGRYLQLVREEGLAIQQPILGGLVGYFTTDIGPLEPGDALVGLRRPSGPGARRQQLANDSRWQAFLPKLSENIEQAENRILVPTDFSPLRHLSHPEGSHEEKRL